MACPAMDSLHVWVLEEQNHSTGLICTDEGNCFIVPWVVFLYLARRRWYSGARKD